MREHRGWWLPDRDEHWGLMPPGPDIDYQGDSRNALLKLVKKFDVAIDGGAHVGFWCKDFCKRFKHVHAFEPVVEHWQCLEKNVPYANLTIHREALGDTPGAVGMITLEGNSGGAHVDPEGDGVQMVSIDSFGFPTVDLIKLDVESWELHACRGAERTLLRCKPTVCIEQSAHRNNDTTQFEAQKYLESLGMKYITNCRKDFFFGW